MKKAKLIISEVNNSNYNNKKISLWGTCQGFQLITFGFSTSHLREDDFDDEAKKHNLRKFKKNIKKNLNKYNSLESMMSTYMKDESLKPDYLYYHHHGFTPSTFLNDPFLQNSLQILYYSRVNNSFFNSEEENKNDFVAIFEHKELPIYAVQFHPEKLFTSKPHIPFTNVNELRVSNNYFYKFFVHKILSEKAENCKQAKSVKTTNLNKLNIVTNQINDFTYFDETFDKMKNFYEHKIVYNTLNSYSYKQSNYKIAVVNNVGPYETALLIWN